MTSTVRNTKVSLWYHLTWGTSILYKRNLAYSHIFSLYSDNVMMVMKYLPLLHQVGADRHIDILWFHSGNTAWQQALIITGVPYFG